MPFYLSKFSSLSISYINFRSLCSLVGLFSLDFLPLKLQNIGQAYDDVHSQNKRLLQEIIERDEYNAQVWLHYALNYL